MMTAYRWQLSHKKSSSTAGSAWKMRWVSETRPRKKRNKSGDRLISNRSHRNPEFTRELAWEKNVCSCVHASN